jgi:hypothetical protein
MLRVAAYLIESVVLSAMFWTAACVVAPALVLTSAGTRTNPRFRFQLIFSVTLAANVITTEFGGSDQIFLHRLAFLALLASLALRIALALLSRGERPARHARCWRR